MHLGPQNLSSTSGKTFSLHQAATWRPSNPNGGIRLPRSISNSLSFNPVHPYSPAPCLLDLSLTQPLPPPAHRSPAVPVKLASQTLVVCQSSTVYQAARSQQLSSYLCSSSSVSALRITSKSAVRKVGMRVDDGAKLLIDACPLCLLIGNLCQFQAPARPFVTVWHITTGLLISHSVPRVHRATIHSMVAKRALAQTGFTHITRTETIHRK